MYKSKVISLLKTFTPKEFKEFGIFLKSPFYNNESVQIKLYDHIKNFYPQFDQPAIVKEKVFKRLYPDKNYNDALMRNILSDLLGLAEKFLSVRSFWDDEFQNRINLLKELRKRNQETLFTKAKRNVEKHLEQLVKDQDYFHKKALLEHEVKKFIMSSEDALVTTEYLDPKIAEYFLSSFLVKILLHNSSILNARKHIFDYPLNTVFTDEVSSFLEGEGSEFLKILYVRIYYNVLMLLKTDDEKYFYEIRKAVTDHRAEIDINDLSNLYSLLLNYSYSKINSGVSKYKTQLFRLSKEYLESKAYKAAYNKLRHITYLSAVTAALDVGEFEWTEKMINGYRDELSDEIKGDSFNMAYAIFYYRKKDFDKALQYLPLVTSNDMSFKFNTKSLYLKIYFDMKDSEPFYSHIDAFKHFLSNNKLVSEGHKKLLGNYVSYAQKLFKLKNEPEKSKDYELKKLRKEIESDTEVLNKDWLISKVDEVD